MQEIPEEKLRALARKMLTGTITPEEQKVLEQWLNAHPGHELLWEQNDTSEEELGNRIFKSIAHDGRIRRKKRIYWAAAASVIILASAGIYTWYAQPKAAIKQTAQAIIHPAEIIPGSDKAILTLGNGRQVKLEGQKIITDGELHIKNENNELIYSASSVISRNTMSTPRGGQYQLRLPDGSRVWLNASSSITYPTVFTGKERVVELSGEAYFEVTNKPAMPFTVKITASPYSPFEKGGGPQGRGISEIHVLGTSFNVMAYDDESLTKTTLLEGAVQVTKGAAKAILKPGEEASINNTGEKIKTATADIEQATAWKNGMFLFNRTDIKSIMRQLGRWYDFEVKYENEFQNRNFSGMISRKTELSQVLKMLQMTKDVKFKVEGRTVTVI